MSMHESGSSTSSVSLGFWREEIVSMYETLIALAFLAMFLSPVIVAAYNSDKPSSEDDV